MSNPMPAVSKLENMEAGAQPLDRLMQELGLSNHDVVAAAEVNSLTHKVVAKARRGRKLTRKAQDKIVAALNRRMAGRGFTREDCFNYAGR